MDKNDIRQAIAASLEDRVRDAIKGVLEQVMEEEMDSQLQARHLPSLGKGGERTERRRGERNGHYGRGLTTTAGHRRGGIARQSRSACRERVRCRS